MRPSLARLVVLPACLLTLTLAGCGGGDSGGSLDTALSYLPDDLPLVLEFDTDIEGDQHQALDALVERFTLGEQARAFLLAELAKNLGQVDLERDVKPLLGNPVVVAGSDFGSLFAGGDEEFVAAIQVPDESKLGDLVENAKPTRVGEASGTTVYLENGTFYAPDGDVLVLAGSRELLEDALARKGGDGRLDEETFEQGFEGLPDDPLARLYVNVEALLDGEPDTLEALVESLLGGDFDIRGASKVKWVGALRTFGATASANDNGIEIEFNLRTESEGLSDEDLPVAPGEGSPKVVTRPGGEINIGVRGVDRIIELVEDVYQATDPSGYGDYSAAKRGAEERYGVDIDRDLFGQLGDVSLSIAVTGGFALRAELEDPATFKRALARISDVLPDVAEFISGESATLERPARGEDLYELTLSGGDTLALGVVNDVFVLAGNSARARELATATPRAVPGARGAVVLSADAEQLANDILDEIGPLDLPFNIDPKIFTPPLEELTGSVLADTEGLHGEILLRIE
jgi:hypothetical protein